MISVCACFDGLFCSWQICFLFVWPLHYHISYFMCGKNFREFSQKISVNAFNFVHMPYNNVSKYVWVNDTSDPYNDFSVYLIFWFLFNFRTKRGKMRDAMIQFILFLTKTTSSLGTHDRMTCVCITCILKVPKMVTKEMTSAMCHMQLVFFSALSHSLCFFLSLG